MTLSVSGNITVPSNTTDACNRAAAGEVVICESTSNTVRRFDLTTFSQNGSSVTTISSPNCIAQNGANSFIVGSNSVTTVAYVDVVAATSSNFTGLSSSYSASKNQQIAGETSTGHGFMCTSTTGRLVYFDGTTATNLDPDWLIGTKATTVINIPGSSSFVFGTESGQIVVTDSTGVSTFCCSIAPSPNPVLDNISPSVQSPSIAYLAYVSNLIIASTVSGHVVVFRQGFNKEIHRYSMFGTGAVFSNVDGITMLAAMGIAGNTQRQFITELDTWLFPMKKNGHIWASALTDRIRAMGLQGGTKGWILQNSSTTMNVVTVSSTRTYSATLEDTSPALDLPDELLILKDSGAGTMALQMSCIIGNVVTAPMSTSSNIITVARRNNGTDEQADVRRNNT